VTRLVAGKLVGVFGVKGELKCVPSSLGADLIVAGRDFACSAEGESERLRCTSARKHHERLVVAFEGVSTVERARALVGHELFSEPDEIKLGPDEYLDRDLIGLRLLDESGRELGTVVGVEHLPAQDCLMIAPNGALVPLVRAFSPAVDLAAGTIVMSLPEGLLEP
jgi:16S rRNA processing protein RimM